MKQICFKSLIIILVGLFLTWQMAACGLQENSLPEDARSHGRLDPEAQRRLANPERTAKEHEDEIKKLQEEITDLENQIDVEKLGCDFNN